MSVADLGSTEPEQPYEPKRISVIVPTFRRPDALAETLASLSRLDHPADRYEVVVVDDGSGDETADVVRAAGNGEVQISYVEQSNSGVARARNNGAEHATGDLLVFLDDDLLVEPDHLKRHVEDQGRFGDALVNGHWEFSPEVLASLRATPFGRFRIDVESWVKEGLPKEPLSDGYLEPEGVTACNLGVRAETFARLNGFDETFPYAGCEDQDLSLRARDAGMPFVYDTDIRLLHNDRRLTLEEFGERQRRGALTHVHLAMRHPEVRRQSRMLRENGPVEAGEPPRRIAKKALKRALATAPGMAVARGAARVLERLAPNSRALWRTYWAILGLYIFTGIREGLAASR
jgi:glycosyltransferase involved in cell wall biosynthesis